MLSLNGEAPSEISDGTRNFQNAVIRPGAETQLRDGDPQQFLGIPFDIIMAYRKDSNCKYPQSRGTAPSC